MVAQVQAVERSSGPCWRWIALIVAIIAGGGVLRFWDLDRQSLWFDEGYSAWMITHPARQIVHLIRYDVSPPLYYLLLRAWTQSFGDSEFALRAMSAVAGCLSLPLVAMVARRMTGSWGAATVATLVMGVSVLQVQYAQEARSYGLASMLALLAFYGIVRRMTGGWRWLVLAGVAAGAAVWLHNMMWFYLAGLSLAYLLAPGQVPWRKRVLDLVWMNGLIVAVYIPWMGALREQMRWLSGNFWAAVPTLGDLGQVLLASSGMKVMHLSAVGPRALVWIAAGVLGLLILLAAVRGRREDVRWTLAVLVYAAGPILVVFIHAWYQQSFFVEKVFTASTIAVPLLAGMAVGGRARWVGRAAVVLLLAGGTLSLWGYYRWEQKEDWRSAVAYVNQFPREGTLVVFVANEGQLLYDYYTRRSGQMARVATGAPQAFLELDPPRTIQRVLDRKDLRRLRAHLDETSPDRVILVLSHTHFSDPQMLTRGMLEERMDPASGQRFAWIDIVEFRTRH